MLASIVCYFLLKIRDILQGTILDRIDYNVEQASVQVEKGLEQLKKVRHCWFTSTELSQYGP